MTLDQQLGTIGVELTEPEARFLAGAIGALLAARQGNGQTVLTDAQERLAFTIAGKFDAACVAKQAELRERWGSEAANSLAQRSLDRAPDVELIASGELLRTWRGPLP